MPSKPAEKYSGREKNMGRGGRNQAMTVQKKVLVISNNKDHVDKDRSTAKRIQLEVTGSCGSCSQAVEFLEESPCDLIFLDNSLDGGDANSCLKSLKNNPGFKHIPVVMVTLENDRNAVLDAVSAGCSGYILRPYSQETFERHISTALQLVRFNEIEMRQIEDAKLMLEMGEYDEAIEEFEEVVTMQSEAQRYYDLGCNYLVREKFGKAIVAFQKAVRINDLFAEAYHGLAEAYKGKGDSDQCQFYLKRAANIYAEFDRMEKVKEIFVDILKYDNAAVNPFNTLGVRLRKTGDYLGAIKAYNQALDLTPNDENIYFNIAKAYFFMDARPEALKYATMALRMNRNFQEAQKLYKKLKGAAWPSGPGARVSKDGTGIIRERTRMDL